MRASAHRDDPLVAVGRNERHDRHDIANPLTNGTHVNGPVPMPGMVAGGLSFDGVDDYVEVLHDSSLDFGDGGSDH